MGDDDRRTFLKVATCGLGGLGRCGDRCTRAVARDRAVAPANGDDAEGSDRHRRRVPPHGVGIAGTRSTSSRREVRTPGRPHATSCSAPRTSGHRSDFEALSGVCPHLGCAVGWEGKSFLCPCHDSRFGVDGARQTGPAQRGLDPLPMNQGRPAAPDVGPLQARHRSTGAGVNLAAGCDERIRAPASRRPCRRSLVRVRASAGRSSCCSPSRRSPARRSPRSTPVDDRCVGVGRVRPGSDAASAGSCAAFIITRPPRS